MEDKTQSLINQAPLPGGIETDDLNILQQIARDHVIEPFAGKKSLETIQKTRSGVEKGLTKLKSASSKAGDWISKTKLADQSQKRVSRFVQEIKEKQSSESITGFFEKLNHATEDFQKMAKKGYTGLEEKTKRLTFTFIEKGLELLLYEDAASWILKRANSCLHRSDIDSLDQIVQLSNSDHEKLIKEFYPYDSPVFQKYLKRFDLSVNVGLGAVVATNIPGTGLLVSLVNMGKTLVKIGNRLNIMSAIYGRQIASANALFKVSASILRSLEDWENNQEHIPLDSGILDGLYQTDVEDDSEAFQDLLGSVVRKEAYIAIPGVGMISLGKINLDDVKMDLVVSHLVINYAEKIRIIDLYGEENVNLVLNDFRQIYEAFEKNGFFKAMRKKIEADRLKADKEKWKLRLKILAGIDMALDETSKNLDQQVKQIFLSTYLLDKEDKTAQIQHAVAEVFKLYFN
ncbi:MAG: hypothetical protein HN580_02020 [Deltaproteobacteria bacterium]|jgi:hypothetical protein|nr:hypothetical protein [Deltaproteobacteria bacterium]MBT4266286.1 hypothetical protein [Deltaproteobacteria bacterium]MBT4639996.1 hypothetical protein [Deltaproteobacteria bacterium]MBT7152371.1 hypothetical protein [Deltaproteobacteria bacterium]MBT7716152.1 hypothetical protein [Deltaproteobacteria bacterium]